MQQASKNNRFSVLNKFYAYSNFVDIKYGYQLGGSGLGYKRFSVLVGVEAR
jgi:hypothetical protein